MFSGINRTYRNISEKILHLKPYRDIIAVKITQRTGAAKNEKVFICISDGFASDIPFGM